MALMIKFSFLIYSLPLILGILVDHVQALFERDTQVLTLSSATFPSLVEQSIKPVLVEFYSPGCPHCVKLVPIWSIVARNLAGHIPVAAVNCQADPLCSRYRISGVPSIKIFLHDDSNSLYFLDYTGPREATAIENWAKGYATSFVKKISEAPGGGVGRKVIDVDQFLAIEPSRPRIIMIKRETLAPSLALNTLSVDFKDSLVIGIANFKLDGPILERRLDVKVAPQEDTLLYLKAGERTARIYEGKLRFPDMKNFIETHLLTSYANRSDNTAATSATDSTANTFQPGNTFTKAGKEEL